MTSPQGRDTMPLPNIDVAILGAADALHMELEPDRLNRLRKGAEYIRHRDELIRDYYEEGTSQQTVFGGMDNLSIEYAKFTERFGDAAARVDFTPAQEDDDDFVIGVGATEASPENTTDYTLRAIRGIQDYVLLVDAGVIKKPEILFGDTNAEMAIAAERLGFFSNIARQNSDQLDKAHKEMRLIGTKLEVSGSFDEIRQRAFSEDTQRLKKILTRRLAAMHVGTQAVNA